MAKSKKQASKKGSDAVEVENSTEVNVEETENASQENGIEDVSTKKKATKVKGKEKKEKSEDDDTEKEEADEIVENGEEKVEKKKTAAKASKKTPAKSKPQIEPARKSSRTPKPVTKEGDSEATYEVEKIVDFRLDGGNPQYLVRWKGYSRGDDTWEDERDLNCPELLQKYKSENPGTEKKAKKRPSKSPAKSAAAKKTKKVEKDYEVEDIVGLRIKPGGKKEFKIRWKGYKESDDSWEPEKHLSCQDLIEKYLEEHEDEVQAEEKNVSAKKAAKKAKSPAKSGKGKKTKRK